MLKSNKKDALGTRLKTQYEFRTRYMRPRRCHTIIRLDGRAFHTYTKNCKRPYDVELMEDMDATAIALCEQISGAKLAYVQSDEISIIVSDFDTIHTEAFFDNNLQKICSISASIASSAFNQARMKRNLQYIICQNYSIDRDLMHSCIARDVTNFYLNKQVLATFDSRVFQIPDPTEIYNYGQWRQLDCQRNAISMVAQSHFSHKELNNKSTHNMLDMLRSKGVKIEDMPLGFKQGRCIVYNTVTKDVEFIDKRTNEKKRLEGVERHVWQSIPAPIFSANPEFITDLLPKYE